MVWFTLKIDKLGALSSSLKLLTYFFVFLADMLLLLQEHCIWIYSLLL